MRNQLCVLFLCAVVLAGCGSSSTDGSSGLSSTATLYALQAAGVSIIPMPEVGCSGSAIPPEKVVELVYAFPEQQRPILATVLNASSTAWSVQMYSGEYGLGLCFPVEDKLVLVPSKWASGLMGN